MSSTTPIKQAKPAAAAGSEKDPVRMIEKLETKTKAVYVLSLPITRAPNGLHVEKETKGYGCIQLIDQKTEMQTMLPE
jgi:hypothetical protein